MISKLLLFYRALLHKKPIILRSLLIIATPYTYLLRYSACRPYHYTPAPRAGSQMVRLRSASEGILCAAKFIGEIIAFEFD